MKEYICKYCNRCFHSSQSHNSHIRKHTSTSKKGYLRGVCKYQQKAYQERLKSYYENPKLCENCSNILPYPNKNRKKQRFCSLSCSTIYNNSHKKTGHTRSKLETWLENELTKKFFDLDIYFNNVDVINAELDVYIPSLKLAFELNGIVHYEPIYGYEKYNKIKNNEKRKFVSCHEKNISLFTIDTTGQRKFSPRTSQKYLKIISEIIEEAMQQ